MICSVFERLNFSVSTSVWACTSPDELTEPPIPRTVPCAVAENRWIRSRELKVLQLVESLLEADDLSRDPLIILDQPVVMLNGPSQVAINLDGSCAAFVLLSVGVVDTHIGASAAMALIAVILVAQSPNNCLFLVIVSAKPRLS